MYELTPAYLADVERRARRFQGQWTGTAGSLAADAIRLLFDRRRLLEELATMSQQLQDANAQIRKAIEVRREAMAAGKSHEEWYAGMLESCCDGGKCHTTTTDDIDEKGPLQDVDQVIAEDDEATKEAGMEIPADYILRAQDELRREESDDIRWTGDSILASPADDIRPGTTAKFGTGAVRSSDVEEFRYDLVSPIGLREVARACAEGASKYGDWNWEKGMPVHDLLNHVLAHVYQFLAGDRSEPHLGHAAWGLLAAIHSHELWPELNAGTLRREGCKAPNSERL